MFIVFIFLLFFSNDSWCKANLEQIKSRYSNMLSKKYVMLPHNGTYILPISYNARPNNKPFEELISDPEFEGRGEYNRKLEAEFQFSALFLGAQGIFNSDVDFFVAYTQNSWWQVYNEDWSRPFRETNYSPEVFARINYLDFKNKVFGGVMPILDLGYIHQSNGQFQELSRSWDRLFLRTVIDYGYFVLNPMLWIRLPEKRSEDDNSDILDYMGYGEIKISKTFESLKQISLRIIPGTKRAGFELDYSRPWKGGYRFFARLSSGTGLSLLDYNHESHKFGIGIILSDFVTAK